jgi:hypothetical protein
VRYGLAKFADYFSKVNPLASEEFTGTEGELIDRMIESGRAVIGTPDDAIAQIERRIVRPKRSCRSTSGEGLDQGGAKVSA